MLICHKFCQNVVFGYFYRRLGMYLICLTLKMPKNGYVICNVNYFLTSAEIRISRSSTTALLYNCYDLWLAGENSQIARFWQNLWQTSIVSEIFSNLLLFITRVSQNQVPSESAAWHYWPGICVIKKIMWYSISLKSSFFIVLEFHTVECLVFLFPFSFFYFLFHTKLLLRKCWLVFRTTIVLTLSIYIAIYAICHSHPWHISNSMTSFVCFFLLWFLCPPN